MISAPGSTDTARSGRRPLNRKDALSGTLVVIAGSALFANAWAMDVPQAGNQQIGPDVFPLAISMLMTVLGLLLLGKTLLPAAQSAPTTEVTAEETGQGHPTHSFGSSDMHDLAEEVHDLMEEPPVPWRRLIIVLGIFVAYLAVFIPLGFIVSTALFLGAMTTFVAPEKWIRNAVVAVITSIVVYYCFSSLLGVELPVGLVGW